LGRGGVYPHLLISGARDTRGKNRSVQASPYCESGASREADCRTIFGCNKIGDGQGNPMIWTMRVECIGGRFLEEKCVRVLEVDSACSLLDLHNAIVDSVGFESDHLFEFYIGRESRSRRIFSLLNDDRVEELYNIFAEIRLEQLYPLPKGCRLFYRFDFGDNWRFEVRKTQKKPKEAEPGLDYPRLIEAIGPNPEQHPSIPW